MEWVPSVIHIKILLTSGQTLEVTVARDQTFEVTVAREIFWELSRASLVRGSNERNVSTTKSHADDRSMMA